MYNLRGYKITALLLLAGLTQVSAQRNPNYDYQKRMHFGFSLVANRADFKLVPAKDFYNMDTIQTMRVKQFMGFGLGIIADYRLWEYGHVRILPSLHFCQRNINYTFRGGGKKELKVESTYVDVPLLFKLKSERINDWRFYLIAGGKYSYDLQSKKNKNPNPTDPTIPLKSSSISYDFGCGFDFYFDFFKFSPEIKISNNITNGKVEYPLIYSQAISKLYGQMIQISLHFE